MSLSDPAPATQRRVDLRLVLPAGCGWVAVLVALRVSPWLALSGGVLAAAGAALLTLPRRRRSATTQPRHRILALCLALTALLTSAAAWHGLTRQVGLVDDLATNRATVTLTGVVAADPRPITGTPGERQGEPLVLQRVLVSSVEGRGAVSGSRATVLVFGGSPWLQTRWGERVRFVGRLGPAESGDDVAAVASTRRAPERLARAPALLRGVEAMRSDLRTATVGLPDDPRGLLPALVIGDTSRVPIRLTDDMRATGMSHLTAVSGANVTILLLAVLWVCGWCGVPRRARLPVCLLVLGIFVLLCRPEPSVVRASVMGVVGLLATSAGRPRAAAPALGAAVVLLLLLDPWLASTYGFVLSVLATLGLVLFARSLGAAFAARLPPRLGWLGEPIAVPVAAQAMCAPVVVLLQGSVSLVGIPANILAAPLVAPATIGGVLVVALASVAPPCAALVAWVAAMPAWLIATISHVAAAVPGGTLPWPDGPPGAALLATITVVVLLGGTWLLAHSRRHPVVLVAVMLLVAAGCWPLPRPGWPPPDWVYVACDVGQGDAGVLRTTGGRAVLVDVGPDPAAVGRCLDELGVGAIDAIVLTHFHADHVAGLSGVVGDRRVGQLITTPVRSSSGERDDSSAEPAVLRVAAQHGVPVAEARAGDLLHWSGLQARVLWPGRAIYAGSVQNNASLVLDVRTSGVRLLLTGDIEREGQHAVRVALGQVADPMPVAVLKVAHHGSANHDPALLRQLAAPTAIISVGADNDYGHPAPRLLASLAVAGSRVARTDRDGDLAVVVRGGRALVLRSGG